MALIFCDGFDHYATAQLFQKWSSGSSVSIVSGGREGQGVQIGGGHLAKNLPSNASTLIVGCAMYPNSTNNAIFYFYDNNQLQCSVVCNSDGSLSVQDHTGTTLGTSAPGIVLPVVFQYIEANITFASSGSADLHVNGISVLSISGVNTSGGSGNPYANIVQLVQSGTTAIFDDVYICDATGSTNNDFLGDIKIATLLPNGAGRVNQWSQVGGTSGENYTSVNEVPPDGDSSYVYSSTAGQIDAYTVSSLGSPSAVVAAQIVASARKDDAGTRVLALGFGNGTTESYNAGASLGGNYTMYTSPLDENPLTSSAWETSDFSTAQIAVQVIS